MLVTMQTRKGPEPGVPTPSCQAEGLFVHCSCFDLKQLGLLSACWHLSRESGPEQGRKV